MRPTRPPSWAPPAWGGPRRALPATSSFPSPPLTMRPLIPRLPWGARPARRAVPLWLLPCGRAGGRWPSPWARWRCGAAPVGGEGATPLPLFPPSCVPPPHSVGAPPATVPLRRAAVRLCVCSFRRPPAVGGGTHAPTTVRRTGRLLLLFHRVPPPSVGAGGSGAGAMAQDGEAHGGGAFAGGGGGGGWGRRACAPAGRLCGLLGRAGGGGPAGSGPGGVPAEKVATLRGSPCLRPRPWLSAAREAPPPPGGPPSLAMPRAVCCLPCRGSRRDFSASVDAVPASAPQQ